MAGCRVVQRNLTAWLDGELTPRWAERVRRHVATCHACTAEADSLRAAIAQQQTGLARFTATADLDPSALGRRLQRLIAEEPSRSQTWRWLFHPIAIAGAAAGAAIFVLFAVAGGPRAVLIPLGVAPPPVAVTRTTDLFKDYPIIEHLDAFENYDSVQSVTLDEDQESQRG